MTRIDELTTLLSAMLWEKHKENAIESITEDILRVQRLYVESLEDSINLPSRISQVVESLKDALRHLREIRMPRPLMQALSDDAARKQYDRLRRLGDTTHFPPFEGSVKQTVFPYPSRVVPDGKDTPG